MTGPEPAVPSSAALPAAQPAAATQRAPLLEGRDLELRFGPTTALAGASLSVAAGEVVAVLGASGSGKSTLLHCLAGVLRPDRGEVLLNGERLDVLPDARRSDLRLRRFGFIPQFGDLVPELTLVENVELPLRLTGVGRRPARARALAALADLGIAELAGRRAGEASGGQVQRAAVARALVHRPAVVFADEPTGALDTTTGEKVLAALVALSREAGSAVLIVTHEAQVAAHADRDVLLRDGRQVHVPAVDVAAAGGVR
jgi:putative ABC transport system ATP-binding protein